MKKNIYIILAFFVLFLSNCDTKSSVGSDPKCEIISPADGNIFVPGEEVFISINASDIEGEIVELRLYIDDRLVNTFTKAPYEIYWNNTWDYVLGNYSIEAVAVDNSGAETSHEISVSLGKGLIYDDIIYDLDLGLLEYYGVLDNPSSYNFDVTLYSRSIISENQGNSIYFELFSSSAIDIVNGEYYFDRYSEDPFTFDYSDFSLDYDFSTETGIVGEVSNGIFRIEKVGEIYRVFMNGGSIIGYYEGALEYFDESGNRKSDSDSKLKSLPLRLSKLKK